MPKTASLNQSQFLLQAAFKKCGKKPPRALREPMAAIVLKCRDCSGGNIQNVKECDLVACPLWPHRNGKKDEPLVLTDAQRANLAAIANGGA